MLLRLNIRAASLQLGTRGRFSFKPPQPCCYSTRASDPLRILFCGSDEFSCASLKALEAEHRTNPDLIRSIDVVVRPPKRTGRGLKQIRELPLHSLAKDLNLPIHLRDTFRQWNMPQQDGEPINLIIAVSFGLFVPRRLLDATKYGGLNIHPSLLPDLRGAAPLHHAILLGRTHTGVSLQTLSPEAFDRGTVLAQTPRPGIPLSPTETPDTLLRKLAPLGAEMLVKGLRDGVHVPPYISRAWTPSPKEQSSLREAPKIDSSMRSLIHAGCDETAAGVARRYRALGPLWVVTEPDNTLNPDDQGIRLKLDDIREGPSRDEVDALLKQNPVPDRVRQIRFLLWSPQVSIIVFPDGGNDGSVALQLREGDYITVGRVTVEGQASQPAAVALQPLTQAYGYTGRISVS
ncbi:Methionyl-tRNA formyltransferase [Echria macrotheca]|uniref:methionyl-tRNA formyltransferase n=1 Tax=Echria macrotheca TaxID=438768 RepID=A0AAJ0BLR2_9PEZI|nr:Methionyl-tRNA formyltransferase [Echria macrotheca]